MQWLAIATGGALGALLRYLSSTGLHHWLGRSFPYGTLFVNVVGSLLMGLLYMHLTNRMELGPQWRAFFLVGLLGAFTTFSTFSLELLQIVEQGDWSVALQYAFASCASCFLGVGLGAAIARQSLSSL